MEEDTKSVKGQLLSVCPSLENLPSLDPLLSLWHGVRKRMFMHYQLSARAYFHFLKLSGKPNLHVQTVNCTYVLFSGEQAGSSPGLDDMNVTASLRLLRLLVKYAGELKAELETGFISTPTKPWKGERIIDSVRISLSHTHTQVSFPSCSLVSIILKLTFVKVSLIYYVALVKTPHITLYILQ